MTYWQVAAGESGRDYSDVFLRYGVILLGSGYVRSGHLGSFLENPDNFRGHKDWRKKVVTLAESMKCGDLVVLKRGHGIKGRILAAGRVVGDYEYLRQFDDVEGWDVRHGRRVKWYRGDSPKQVDGLARSTISRVHTSGIRGVADSLLNRKRMTAEPQRYHRLLNAISEEDPLDLQPDSQWSCVQPTPKR